MNIVGFKDVIVKYSEKKILNKVSVEINKGEKIGIVGKNGEGKTTLVKLITGKVCPDLGDVFISKNIKFGVLNQRSMFDNDVLVTDVLYESFEDVFEVYRKMKSLEKIMEDGDFSEKTINKYGRLQQLFEHKSGYEIETIINMVCEGLKLKENMKMKKFNILSEGEKTRVILAKLLIQKPELLILDEPTNHLDIESIEWLEDFLKNYKGTVIVVSHDRLFLDNTIGKIYEVENGDINIFKGNYTNYYNQKEFILHQREKENQLKLEKARKIYGQAETLNQWGNKGNVKDFNDASKKLKQISKSIRKEVLASKSKDIKGDFKNCKFSSQEVVKLENVSKKFGVKKLFENLNLIVMKGERVNISGKNGCGKTTVLKGILKEIEFDSGNIKIGPSVKTSYLPQNVKFVCESCSMLELIMDELGLDKKEAIRVLIRHNFEKNDWEKKIKSLSGGERSRLKLAVLMHNEINLLILDEPTNHLDIFSREWLEKSLESFGGTIIFVSHDRYFVSKFATRVIKVSENI